jgi:8-oxo-dGTP pyrophosphatase MutT (NUDIX family)
LSAFTWPPESPGPASADPAGAREPGAQAPRPSGERRAPVAAAVLVPLFVTDASPEPYVVLTRRRADLRRHAGEISFPGGRRDAQDADLTDTALREAEEEIGLERSRVSVLGALPATSTFATNYVIHPFVGEIPAGVAWRLSAREVDAVLELRLADVRAGRTRTRMQRRGITFETDAYVVGEHLIWGATARILQDLLERLAPAAAGGRLSLS